MIIVEVFQHNNKIIVWCKEKEKNRYLSLDFEPEIFFLPSNKQKSDSIFSRFGIKIDKTIKKDFMRKDVEVLRLRFQSIIHYRKYFKKIELLLMGSGTFYNVDIPIEEMFLFKRGLFPFAEVDSRLNLVDNPEKLDYIIPCLRSARIRITTNSVEFNSKNLSFKEFKKEFLRYDPDIIFIHHQQNSLIELCSRLNLNLNRLGNFNSEKKKGISFFSYGSVYYREMPLYLKGRILINSAMFMDGSFNIFSLIEGSRICRMTLQRLASHSVGAAITNLLTVTAYNQGYLIPYKFGIVEDIKPFRNLVELDRGALTLEPFTGTHNNVAELDFVSMFPSIISKYNMSPETYNCSCCNNIVPGTSYNFCTKKKGIVPVVCDFLMQRRASFKTRKDKISKSKVEYLKWLLVVIFGFQSFRNKKIGMIEIHEAINSAAREILLKSIRIAEKNGFLVVHGIVDSLYIKKKSLEKFELELLVNDINAETGLIIELKKVFRHITFLPSVNNPDMPVPTAYYGVASDGSIKVRGIELRQRNSPLIVRQLQKDLILSFDKGIKEGLIILRKYISLLDSVSSGEIAICSRIGKANYKANCPQKFLLERMRKKGIIIHPGQTISYFIYSFEMKSYKEISEFEGIFDKKKYKELMIKAMKRIFCNLSTKEILSSLDGQERLDNYITQTKIVYT